MATDPARKITLEEAMKQMGLGPPRPFRPVVWVNKDGGLVELYLEDVPCYHEWIAGERADASIIRAMDDHRVIGVCLDARGADKIISAE